MATISINTTGVAVVDKIKDLYDTISKNIDDYL